MINNLKRWISPLVVRSMGSRVLFGCVPKYSFAMMSLFEQPKKPEELSSVFKKPERIKGHLKDKNRKGYISPKLNTKTRVTPLLAKNHKGMLKRVKIVLISWCRWDPFGTDSSKDSVPITITWRGRNRDRTSEERAETITFPRPTSGESREWSLTSNAEVSRDFTERMIPMWMFIFTLFLSFRESVSLLQSKQTDLLCLQSNKWTNESALSDSQRKCFWFIWKNHCELSFCSVCRFAVANDKKCASMLFTFDAFENHNNNNEQSVVGSLVTVLGCLLNLGGVVQGESTSHEK